MINFSKIKDCGCRGKCSCETIEVFERVKKRYHLSKDWPYWAIPSKLIEKECQEILKEIIQNLKHDNKTN